MPNKTKLRCDWDENDAKYVWYCGIRNPACVHLYCKSCMRNIVRNMDSQVVLKNFIGSIS